MKTQSDPTRHHRWLYLSQNLQVTANVPKVLELLKRAKTAGYNGLVLADFKLNILDRVPDHYFKNAAAAGKALELQDFMQPDIADMALMALS